MPLALGLVAVSPAVRAQPAPPWAGTWKLNAARSKFSGATTLKSAIVTIEATANGLKSTQDQVMGTGEPRHLEVTASFDGTDVPVKDNPEADTQAYTRIDDRTYEVTAKKNGKVTTVTRVTISADGKTRTATQTGHNAKGQTVANTLVYDRQ